MVVPRVCFFAISNHVYSKCIGMVIAYSTICGAVVGEISGDFDDCCCICCRVRVFEFQPCYAAVVFIHFPPVTLIKKKSFYGCVLCCMFLKKHILYLHTLFHKPCLYFQTIFYTPSPCLYFQTIFYTPRPCLYFQTMFLFADHVLYSQTIG